MRRILALALTLCLCLLPAISLGETSAMRVSDGRLVEYTGATGALSIPAELAGEPLRAIGQGLFYINPNITAANLAEGIQLIESNAFYTCEQLTEVSLPDSLQVIDDSAFFGSGKLQSITIPAGVAMIGNGAFGFCEGLQTVTFTGAPPVWMGEKVFEKVSASFIVPADYEAAYEALLGLDCQPGPNAIVVDRTAAQHDLAVENGVLTKYTGQSIVPALPASLGGQAITAIGPKAFHIQPLLRLVNLPEGIQQIEDGAFSFSALRLAQLPQSLSVIGADAFRGTGLKQIELPAGLGSIGDRAFAYTQLKEISLPAGVTSIPQSAFEGCIWLADAYLSPATALIGAKAFSGASALNYLVLPVTSLPQIAPDAFSGCPLGDVDLAPEATKADAQAALDFFEGLGINASVWRADPPGMPPYPAKTPFTFDEATGLVTSYSGELEALTAYWNFWKADNSATVALTGLADGVFEGASLKRFVVPRSNAFTTIGARAFKNSQLEEIDLFDSVTSIGAEAFSGAPLKKLVLPADVQLSGDIGVVPEKIQVRAEASEGQISALRQALDYPWYMALRRVGEPDPFRYLPEDISPNAESDFEFDPATGTLRKYVGSAADVIVPPQIGGVDVQAIGELAFSDASVVNILADAAGNTRLKSIVLPHTVRQIGDSAFLGSKQLSRFESYGPVDRLGIRAFEDCAALETVIFHNGVREIDMYAFNLCAALTQLQLGEGLSILGEGALTGCAKLQTLRLPASLSRIDNGAMLGADALESLCLGSADPAVFAGSSYPFPKDAKALRIHLPEGSSDEQLAAFNKALNSSMMAEVNLAQIGGCPQ